MRILITKLASMGDLIHLLPALSDAKKAIPSLSVDWVIDTAFHEIATWHPAVNNTILTNHRVWRSHLLHKASYRECRKAVSLIRKQTYDLVIDAQGNLKTALLNLCAKGPKGGWDGSSTPEWGSHFLYHHKAKTPKSIHALERLRHLLSHLLQYALPLHPPHYGLLRHKFRPPSTFTPPSSPFLVFVPLASKKEKLWPEPFWQGLIQRAATLGLPILIPSGNQEETQRAHRLHIHPLVTPLPVMSLTEMAFILEKATAMVSLDTGLSHIAAALDTPNITLYGPTDPQLTGTVGKNQYWISASYLKNITPEEVSVQLQDLLQNRSKAKAHLSTV